MKRLRFQISLSALLLLVTVTAVAIFGVNRWRTTRPEYLVEKLIRLMETGEYSKAGDVADLAITFYPENEIVLHHAWRAKILRRLPEGYDLSQLGFKCHLVEDNERDGENEIIFGSDEKWEEISQSRLQALKETRQSADPLTPPETTSLQN